MNCQHCNDTGWIAQGQGYWSSVSDCPHCPVFDKRRAGQVKRPYWQVYQDDAGQWRWRLRAANNRILADSGEGYTRERDCHRAVDLVRVAAATRDKRQ